jgi:YD repeat-containing protein
MTFFSVLAGMKRNWLLFFCVFFPLLSQAQYYYQDIYSTELVNANQAEYKRLHVKKITITSLDANMQADDAFFIKKEIRDDYATVFSNTRSNVDGNSTVTSYFNPVGLIISSTDSSQNGINKTVYRYNAHHRIVQIKITSSSPQMVDIFNYSEVHTYYYDEKGYLSKMIVVRNMKDSSFIAFTTNETGEVTRETLTGATIPTEIFDYKYNGLHQITDVERYDPKKQKEIPDLMFEYNDEGKEIAMTTVTPGTSNYNLWRYEYDANGLRVSEKCYQQGETMLGAVKYDYTY